MGGEEEGLASVPVQQKPFLSSSLSPHLQSVSSKCCVLGCHDLNDSNARPQERLMGTVPVAQR